MPPFRSLIWRHIMKQLDESTFVWSVMDVCYSVTLPEVSRFFRICWLPEA